MNKDQILERMKEIYYDTGGILPMGKIIEGDSTDLDDIEESKK